MQYAANTTYDRRAELQRKLEKAEEWSRKPMTNRAECAVAAIAGSLMFALFTIVYLNL